MKAACRQDGCQYRNAVEHGVFMIASGGALHEVQQRDRTSVSSNYWQNQRRKNKEQSAVDLSGG